MQTQVQTQVQTQTQAQTTNRKSRKTFATATLRKINSRLQYYRRILNTTDKHNKRLDSIKQKYDRDMKIRALLNRAIRNLYDA